MCLVSGALALVFPVMCCPGFPGCFLERGIVCLVSGALALVFTVMCCPGNICPLSSSPARTAPSNPWLSDVLREHRTRLRAAERKWHKSNYPSIVAFIFQQVHTAKSSYFHNKFNSALDMRNLLRTFNSLLCPPLPPPTNSITADDFATFFPQTKLEQSVVSFHLHTHRTSNQPNPLLKLPSSPSVPSLRRKYPNLSSHILQYVF